VNPITRMMKRCIKTPLKYALPLLFIGSLALVSISGCTSSTSNPTATPSATPSVTTTTSSFDPLLVKLQTALNSEYGSTWLIGRMNASGGANEIYMTPKANSSTVTNVWFTNDGSIANASANFAAQADLSSGPNNSTVLTPSLESHIGSDAATVALGHTPSTVNDAYFKGTGDWAGFDNEYIQYDQIFVYSTLSPSSS